MKRFKGTEKPWKVQIEEIGFRVVARDADGRLSDVAQIPIRRNSFTVTQNRANAKIISKSPEMLEMLIKVLAKLPIGAMVEEQIEIKQLIKEVTEL